MALIKRRDLKRTKIEIIPMIDTMFFLLVFFILASLNIVDVKGQTVDLPPSSNQDRQAPSKLTVTVKRNGEVTVNKTDVVVEGQDLGLVLVSKLREQSTNGEAVRPEETNVVINADRRATYAMVRKVIDAARQRKFKSFSIATNPKLYGGE
jgi:biopolymer transport protein ExbD